MLKEVFLKNMFLTLINSFVNIFDSGRSEIKIALFFIYILLLTAVYFLFRKKPLKKYSWKYFGFGVLLMYLYGLGLQIFYTINNSIGLFNYFNTGGNNEFASSSLWHSHIAKGSIGLIAYFFGKEKFQNTDAGIAYLGQIPNEVFFIGAIILLFIICAALFYFITSFRLFLKNKNKRQKITLIIGYAICSFSLIGGSVDGGIFTRNFLVSSLVVIIFYLREKGKDIKNFYPVAILISGLLLCSGLFFTNLSYTNTINIYYFACLLILYSILLYISEKVIKKPLLILLVTIFLISWWASSLRDRDIYSYSNTLISKGDTVYTYNTVNNNIETFVADRNESIGELSSFLEKNISYAPVYVDGLTCKKKNPATIINLTLISRQSVDNVNFKNFSFVRLEKGKTVLVGKNFKTNLTFYINQCTPEMYSVINGVLVNSGVSNYILEY